MVKYVVRLTDEERTALTQTIGTGKAAARKIQHANVLLKRDAGGPNGSDAQAAAFDCRVRPVFSIRQRLVEAGWEAALERKKREHPPRARLRDGDGEAQRVRIACAAPPAVHARWTLKLLADRRIALPVVATLSLQTVT
jgi:hypothetical protein